MVNIPDEAVQAALEYYSEGGCMGLDSYERKEVAKSMLEAAFPYLHSGVFTKPVDVTTVRRQAFDEGFENGVEQSLDALNAYDDITRNEAEQAIIKLKPDYRALSAEPAQGEQWQPIETCPARHVLFYGKTAHDKDVIFEGWKSKSGLLYAGDSRNPVSPTHWMPLPSAPTSEAGR